jgi:hypothetical protein
VNYREALAHCGLSRQKKTEKILEAAGEINKYKVYKECSRYSPAKNKLKRNLKMVLSNN